jgi:peptide deformylase
MILNIIKVPDKILKQKSLNVVEINDEIRDLANNMLETMYKKGGVGLAGVQVGVLKKIVVIDVEQTKGETEEEKIKNRKPIIFINPTITWKSQETKYMEEGCLSIPGGRIEVLRHLEIEVEYLDLENKKQKIRTNNYLSHALQHEIDHTNGICNIDYLSKLKRDLIIDKVKKIG